MKTRITQVLGVEFPIVQGGMIWCSGWKLASAVSEAGGLGLIGSGSMYPDVLEEHIRQCKAATNKPFGVNLPLLYPQIADHIEIILRHQVPIVFTSAGNPKTYAPEFQKHGIKVIHVVSSAKFAVKAQEAGCCAVVAEGFEAGGHNGREETTTMCLIPAVTQAVQIPVIAAGGIYHGKSMAAAFALGAEGVQMGSRFIATPEASAHDAFKEAILKAGEGETLLTLKELTPVRLLRNPFFQAVMDAYARGATREELAELLGRGRAKQGMYLGNMTEGELEVGQVSAMIQSIKPAGDVVREVMSDFLETCASLGQRAIN